MDVSEDLDTLIDLHECATKKTEPESEQKTGEFKLSNGGRPIENSEIHAGDTDSSDDEDNRNCSEQKYSDFGKFAKSKLKESETKYNPYVYQKQATWKQSEKTELGNSVSILQDKPKTKTSFENYSDFYGIRIINPLISSQSLREKMSDRHIIPLDKISNHLNNLDSNKDCVIAGVIVSKCTRVSQKGKQYCLWSLSDLKPGLKTVSLFLFGKAYSTLWKTNKGAVVAVLNPTVIETKSTIDVAAFSVNDANQVMMCGISKDLGLCKAIKKNGEPCSSFVNLKECEYCIYHVKQEYKKFTGRSELQSPSGGNIQNLRNKVLGKNEVFYAGKSFTANTVAAKRNAKKVEQDQKRLQKLGGLLSSVLPSTAVKSQTCPTRSQKIKDAERLRKLTGSPVTINSVNKKSLLSCDKPENLNMGSKSSINQSKNLQQKSSSQNNSKKKHSRDMTNCDEFSLWKKDSVKNVSKPATVTKDNLYSNSKDDTILNLDKIKNCEHKNVNDTHSINQNKSPPLNEIKPNTQDCDNKLKSRFYSVDKNPLKTKMQPTKSRFENLTNITSNNKEKTSSLNTSVEVVKLKAVHNSLIDLSSPVTQLKPVQDSLIDLSTPVEKLKTVPTVNSLVDLSSPRVKLSLSKRQNNKAKLNAVKVIQKIGPIKKKDPNAVKKSPKKKSKRTHDELEEENIRQKEETCVISSRFMELMKATSQNEALLEIEEQKNLEEYYNKMEKKEQLEEKMLTTFKLDCKAVKCIKCKYKWFSASELCKSEGHPLKVITAIKRFFKCGNCGNRTVSLEIIPLQNCGQCGSSNWERAPMLRERKYVNHEQLSIRGGEQKFMNSVESNGNLNLLVPD